MLKLADFRSAWDQLDRMATEVEQAEFAKVIPQKSMYDLIKEMGIEENAMKEAAKAMALTIPEARFDNIYEVAASAFVSGVLLGMLLEQYKVKRVST